jgi:hypothetical protein
MNTMVVSESIAKAVLLLALVLVNSKWSRGCDDVLGICLKNYGQNSGV